MLVGSCPMIVDRASGQLHIDGSAPDEYEKVLSVGGQPGRPLTSAGGLKHSRELMRSGPWPSPANLTRSR